MTVQYLRELLAQAPPDMLVMVSVENHLHPGVFAFMTPCPCETGIAALQQGVNEDDLDQEAFLILPHGFSVTEQGDHDMTIAQAN